MGSGMCADIGNVMSARADGRLDAAGEDRLRAHLAACADCRARAERLDPACLFMTLAGEPIPDGTWNGFQESLRARLSAEAAAPAGWRAVLSWPRLAWAAPALMVLIVGVTLTVSRPARQRLAGWRKPSRPPVALTVPAAMLAPGPGSVPGMEGVASPGARVYRFSVGAPGDETPIYFVIDASIDL